MEPIKKIVAHAVRGGTAQSVAAAQAVEAAQNIIAQLFEPSVAAHIKPLYLKNRTLTVSCIGSTIAQELKLREEQILSEMERLLGQRLVDRIRYFA